MGALETAMPMPVSLWVEQGIAQVRIDWPPVNVLSEPVRRGLFDRISDAIADSAVRAIVIGCAGRTFVSGGDIKEFGRPIAPPDVNDILGLIEASPKPVVAAMRGTVLGGGLELAMACHGRVADPQTVFGLPEVTLGLLPGAGGTIRLPRLVGLPAAIEMITSGQPIPIQKAIELGLVDGINADVEAGAIEMAKRLADEGRIPRTDQRKVRPAEPQERAKLLGEASEAMAKRYPWSTARQAALDSIENGLGAPLADALVFERALFEKYVAGAEGRALMHAFLAERKLGDIPGLDPASQPRDVASAAVIGSGTMGRGIAIVFARAGIPVVLIDKDEVALARASVSLDQHFEREVEKQRLNVEKAQAQRQAIRTSLAMSDLAEADLVIEAVFEEMAVKLAVFRDMNRLAKPGAILATNTSSLDVLAMAKATGRPQDVIGLHFFSPAHVMPLLEFVRTEATGSDVLKSAVALAKRIRKTGVVAGNCFGFIANRMIFEYQRQSEFLVEEGATPADVDRVLKAFGMPMGPFEMFDMAGLDVGWRLRKGRNASATTKRYSRLNDRVCEQGWFGQKTARGWFDYDADGRNRRENPELPALIEAVRGEAGIIPRAISDEEIRDRCLLALVNEGAKILDEGFAIRASDIDVAYLAGFGFPRYRGGPMHYVSGRGLPAIVARIAKFRALDPDWWVPAQLLCRLADDNKSFDDFDRGKGR